MIDLQAIFKNKRLDADKLPHYGFVLTGNRYEKNTPIMQGQFSLKITVAPDGTVDYRVYDIQTGEEYFLARVPEATGIFVGEVHAACEEILSDIAQKCFYTEHFQNGQTQRILLYVREKYGATPEFLWKIYPDYAVLRVPGKKSWFALLGKVEKSKFGLSEGGFAEVINLKNEPKFITSRIKEQRAYPAYHMNKQCWFSMFTDDTLPDKEIFSLIDVSFALVNS